MKGNSQGTVSDYPVKEKIKKMLFKIELHRTAQSAVVFTTGGVTYPVPLKPR